MTTPLVTAADLENAIGTQSYKAIFDDRDDGVVNTAAVALVIRDGISDAMRHLGKVWDVLPEPPPDGAKTLALDFVIARAWRRHPEFGRTTGMTMWNAVEAAGSAVALSTQQAAPDQPNPRPALPADEDVPVAPGASAASLVAFGPEGSGEPIVDGAWWRWPRCR